MTNKNQQTTQKTPRDADRGEPDIEQLDTAEEDRSGEQSHHAGEDPVEDEDPNAEGMAPEADDSAPSQVSGLRREIERVSKKPVPKDEDDKAQGGRRTTM